MAMKFEVKKAIREKVYVKIALMGCAGAGKTYSALRLASGMVEEIEKEFGRKAKILMLNTEASRGRYYADEFDYDIIDLEPTYEPEKFVDAMQFAVNSGYDILIMDSTSPEWEGKGGCLELHQRAGGQYQHWKTVSPRHQKFIDTLISSNIHIIATMRGKDQYETSKNENGKTSVQKLSVGAKQRDGFEYEFTCSFLIDQKTSTAEVQKDNTHIFDAQGAVVLTEAHGADIIKWANKSKIEPKKPSVDVGELISKIDKIARKLIANGAKPADVANTIANVDGMIGNNYNLITDANIANAVIDVLENFENNVEVAE